MKDKVFVLFSGGVDSAGLLFNLLEKGFECFPIYFKWRTCNVAIKEVKIINWFYEMYKDKYPLFHKPEIHFEREIAETIDTKENIMSRNRIFLKWLIDRCIKENIHNIGMGEYSFKKAPDIWQENDGKNCWIYYWGPPNVDCDANDLQGFINKNNPKDFKIKLWTLDDFGIATFKHHRVEIGRKVIGYDMFKTTCLLKGTQILMENYSIKFIEDIVVGDIILGLRGSKLIPSRVIRLFKRTSSVGSLKYNKKELLSITDNHKILQVAKDSEKTYVIPSELVSTIRVYDINNSRFLDDWYTGWLAGYTEGDGCLRQLPNNYVLSYHSKDIQLLEFVNGCLTQFGIPKLNIKIYATYRGHNLYKMATWKKSTINKVKEVISFIDTKDYMRGYLAGIYDAEGSNQNTCKHICISNSNPVILSKIEKFLKCLKYSYKKRLGHPKGTGNLFSNNGKRYLSKRDLYLICMPNYIKFNIECKPVLKRKIKYTSTTWKLKDRICNFKYINNIKDNQVVYNLETETGNYIANGIIVHNCCGKGGNGPDCGGLYQQDYLCAERHVAMLKVFGYDNTFYLKDPKFNPYFIEYCVQMNYLPGILWTLKNNKKALRISKLNLIKILKEY